MKILKLILKYLFGAAFVLAGIIHFYKPEFYLRMMPPMLPASLFLIYLSGFFEIALGVLLLIPKYSRLAAWGLIGLLIAVYPANIYMAMHTELFPEFSPTAQYIRLPLQLIMIALAFWLTKNNDE